MATRSKKPSCDGKTSQSCGMGCISREDTCSEAVAENIATRLVALATQFKQANDAPGKSFSSVADNFPANLLKAAHKTGVATKDLGNGAVLTTKEAVGLDGSTVKYGFVTDADGKRYTVSDGLVKEVTGAAGSEWDEAFQAAVRSKIAKAEAPVKSSPRLSSDVVADISSSGLRTYAFKVGDSKVSLTVLLKEPVEYDANDNPYTDSAGEGNSGSVSFTVNRSYYIKNGNSLSPRDSAKVAIKLASIIKYDASTRPDGFEYTASAASGDGNEAKRSLAYERFGFSRPVDGKAGYNQFGLVQDGKVQPNDAKVARRDTDKPGVIESRMAENVKLRQKAKQTA
jgi:hypothetical protein